MSPADSSPQDLYRIEVFADQRAVTAADVIALWRSEAELSPEEGERRLSELLLVACDAEGQLAAVSTAYLQRNEQLRTDMWYFRVFVAAAHRRSYVGTALAIRARDRLEHQFVSGEDRRAIGIAFEVESEILKRYDTAAHWDQTDVLFLGQNARGDHVRVRYFPGALAPEPDQGST